MKLPNLSDSKLLVIDTETTGLDWHRDRAIGFALAWGPTYEETGYFPIRHASKNMNPAQVTKWLRDLCKSPERRIANHNLKFDLHMWANDGIEVAGPTECTMVSAALINENQGAFNLKVVSGLYPDVPQKKGASLYEYLAGRFGGEPTAKIQMPNLPKLAGDDAEAAEYARYDALSAWHVRLRQQRQIDDDDLRQVWAVENRVTKTLFRMERRGVAVDEEQLHRVKKLLERMLRDAQKALPKDLNVRSSPQIAAYFRDHGVAGFPITEKGNPSFTEVWLAEDPLGQPIVAVRKISNILNSFVAPLVERHLINGRVHCDFNQLRQDEYGTVTGRLSSSGPNMQQVPKRDKLLAPIFRSIFVPDYDKEWMSNDYSQQEFRVFADYTGSSLLIRGYKAKPPLDIHTAVAMMLKVERDPTAKRINLGLVYGMGAAKLARSLGVSVPEAQTLMSKYHEMIPEAKGFLREAEYWARRRGWVRTKLHRRRRFPDPRFAHKAGNAIIQGSSADMTKLKMVEIDDLFAAHGGSCELLLQVHDELDFQFPESERKVVEEAQRTMESFGKNDAIHFEVPMTVEAKQGHTWGEASVGGFDEKKHGNVR